MDSSLKDSWNLFSKIPLIILMYCAHMFPPHQMECKNLQELSVNEQICRNIMTNWIDTEDKSLLSFLNCVFLFQVHQLSFVAFILFADNYAFFSVWFLMSVELFIDWFSFEEVRFEDATLFLLPALVISFRKRIWTFIEIKALKVKSFFLRSTNFIAFLRNRLGKLLLHFDKKFI